MDEHTARPEQNRPKLLKNRKLPRQLVGFRLNLPTVIVLGSIYSLFGLCFSNLALASINLEVFTTFKLVTRKDAQGSARSLYNLKRSGCVRAINKISEWGVFDRRPPRAPARSPMKSMPCVTASRTLS
jgi:hypothetical protein